jgi:hypothetical protein
MIRTIDTTKLDEPYLNIIEVVYLFLLTEFHIAMSTVKLYDINEHKWNLRRAFWYTVIGMPSILILGIFISAAVKFILQ